MVSSLHFLSIALPLQQFTIELTLLTLSKKVIGCTALDVSGNQQQIAVGTAKGKVMNWMLFSLTFASTPGFCFLFLSFSFSLLHFSFLLILILYTNFVRSCHFGYTYVIYLCVCVDMCVCGYVSLVMII